MASKRQSKSVLINKLIENQLGVIENINKFINNFMETKSDSTSILKDLICQVKFDEYL